MKHPYRVVFLPTADSTYPLVGWVLAEDAKAAKRKVLAGMVKGAVVTFVSSRKTKMSICKFHNHFGKKATESYFGRKV